MAEHKRIVGKGITKREVISYSGEDAQPAFEAWAHGWNAALAGGGQFAAAVWGIERACQRFLAGAGYGPFRADSLEDYAEQILRAIALAKAGIERGDPDAAARAALDLGRITTEVRIRELWEGHALRGRASGDALQRANGDANRRRQDEAASRHAQWQQAADDIWHERPTLSARSVAAIIARDGGEADTIRRYIRRR